MAGRTESELEDVATAIRATGRSTSVIPSDLTDTSQAARIVERTVAQHGRIDILVNNAVGACPLPTSRRPPLTVEKHVERLIMKTGLGRSELARLAESAGVHSTV